MWIQLFIPLILATFALVLIKSLKGVLDENEYPELVAYMTGFIFTEFLVIGLALG